MPALLRGDARALPLPDESVDLIVTSPPYFGLRSYTDGGEHYDGQVGAEATPAEFLDALIACTAEMARVLKPSGSIFLNLGDKYSGHSTADRGEGTRRGPRPARSAPPSPPKSLMLIPERYRIRAVDELGLIARAVIVWAKPNGLPESVTDRVRRSHEDWVHLTRSPRYFAAVDEIREPYEAPHATRSNPGRNFNRADGGGNPRSAAESMNPLGKLPGSVWTIPTQPLRVPAELGVDHFAAFPMEWPRRLILGWSPREVCTGCGEGRRPVTDKSHTVLDGSVVDGERPGLNNRHLTAARGRRSVEATITGYACACPDTTAPTTPAVVLDPFGGTGTTALVAAAHGRRGISVDLSDDYRRLAEWRTADPKERARAAGLDPDEVARIRPQLPGQTGLFDLDEESA